MTPDLETEDEMENKACKKCDGTKWVELSTSDVPCWECHFTGIERGFRVYRLGQISPRPYTYNTNKYAYCSPAWEAAGPRYGGRNHYVLVEASYSDIHETRKYYLTEQDEKVLLLCIDATGGVRWDVPHWSIRYALGIEQERGAPLSDPSEGDHVEHYLAYKHFGLRLPA